MEFLSVLQGILKIGEHTIEYPGCISGLATTTDLSLFQQAATTTPANPSGKKKKTLKGKNKGLTNPVK